MRIELSGFVEADLEATADWIAEDNPPRAVSFIRDIRAAFRRIGDGPQHYQMTRSMRTIRSSARKRMT
jgi:plasmid stabilization system protein ParE